MSYIMTIQVGKLASFSKDGESELAPKRTLVKALVFNDFETAKKSLRESIVELATDCKFFPFKKGKYIPLTEFVSDIEATPEDFEYKLMESLSELFTKSDYFATLPSKVWGFEDHSFISKKGEIYCNIDGSILHFNVLNMTNSEKTYFFDYQKVEDEYEPENFIRILLKPADEA